MHSFRFKLPFSVLTLCAGTTGVLAVVYIGLIAMVMSYAALTVSFSQSVKDDQAAVATLEAQYLGRIASIEGLNYRSAGYAAPLATVFVPAESATALR